MITVTDLILLAAALLSVFFVAGLHNVPFIVRGSVGLIGPGFLLTFLLHYQYARHVDYGLILTGVALILSASTGFRYLKNTPMTRGEKFKLAWRFAIGFALSAVAVTAVAALILGFEKSRASPPKSTQAPVSATVAVGDTTEAAIAKFNSVRGK
jgi:hypothetical protein